MNKNFYVYILECSDTSYYTGYTVDLDKRIKLHNNKKASKYTRSRTPVRYVFTHKCKDKSQAMSYEYRIKRLTREKKEKLVKGELKLDQLISLT